MIAYKMRHIDAYKDFRGNIRAMTWVNVNEGERAIRIVTMRRNDAALVTNARAGIMSADMQFVFESGKDFYQELARVNLNTITKEKVNLYHFAAVREIYNLVEKVTMFYGSPCAAQKAAYK